MEEFIRVAVGDEGFQKVAGGQRERKSGEEKSGEEIWSENTGSL